LNKCDRADAIARIDTGETEDKLMALFQALGANEDQINYTVLYSSARNGWVTHDPTEALDIAEQGYNGEPEHSMKVLLDAIMKDIPEPPVRSFQNVGPHDSPQAGEVFASDPFSLAAVSVGYDQYLGRTCTGRIVSGSVSINDPLLLIKRDGSAIHSSKSQPAQVSGVFYFEGISRTPFEQTVYAGDIVTISGVPDSIAVGDTITSANNPVTAPIETPPLAPPTLAMDFGANDGPVAGKEGTILASPQIRDRLMKETDNNVTLIVKPSENDVEKTTVFARGELQLGILIETMRREGFELIISPPRILICPDTGEKLEPFEEVTVDVDTEYSSTVVSALTSDRKGILLESEITSDDKTRLVFDVPSRGLLGFNSEIASATKGSAVVNHLYLEDRPYAGNLGIGLDRGKLVSTAFGKATQYALDGISARGVLFVAPGDTVYPGMVVGENAKPGDLEVNPMKAKEKNNIR
jgi:GTP-binding protein